MHTDISAGVAPRRMDSGPPPSPAYPGLRPGGPLGVSETRCPSWTRDPEQLLERYPRLIVVDIFGYGRGGPLDHKRAYDLLIQAEGGSCSITGTPGAPPNPEFRLPMSGPRSTPVPLSSPRSTAVSAPGKAR